MKAAASAACKISLKDRHAHDPNVYAETCVLPQMREGEIAERIADIPGVVKEQKCEWVVNGERARRF
jgi:hypothetical protein